MTNTPGLLEYPPLIFEWQKWPMKFHGVALDSNSLGVSIIFYFQRHGACDVYVWDGDFSTKLANEIKFDERGRPTNKSLERFYRHAHLVFSRMAAQDPSIQAFRPDVGDE
jgi:hypothetical protein